MPQSLSMQHQLALLLTPYMASNSSEPSEPLPNVRDLNDIAPSSHTFIFSISRPAFLPMAHYIMNSYCTRCDHVQRELSSAFCVVVIGQNSLVGFTFLRAPPGRPGQIYSKASLHYEMKVFTRTKSTPAPLDFFTWRRNPGSTPGGFA